MQNDSDFVDLILLYTVSTINNKSLHKTLSQFTTSKNCVMARQSLSSHHIGLGSIPDQSMVEWWWTSLGWDSF